MRCRPPLARPPHCSGLPPATFWSILGDGDILGTCCSVLQDPQLSPRWECHGTGQTATRPRPPREGRARGTLYVAVWSTSCRQMVAYEVAGSVEVRVGEEGGERPYLHEGLGVLFSVFFSFILRTCIHKMSCYLCDILTILSNNNNTYHSLFRPP